MLTDGLTRLPDLPDISSQRFGIRQCLLIISLSIEPLVYSLLKQQTLAVNHLQAVFEIVENLRNSR